MARVFKREENYDIPFAEIILPEESEQEQSERKSDLQSEEEKDENK